MPFNRRLQAHTSGFQNNCGMNALVHILLKNKKQLAEAVNCAAPTDLQQNVRKTIVEFVDKFNKYYNLTGPSAIKNWDELMKKLDDLGNPLHQEIVLGPLLRLELGTDRAANAAVPLTDTDVAAVANRFGMNVESYYSWAGWKKVWESNYRQHLRELNEIKTDAEIKKAVNDAIEQIKKDKEEAETQVDQLQMHDDDGTPVVVQNDIPIDTLKLFNTGNHWEYQGTDAVQVKAHNAHYSSANATRSHFTTEQAENIRAGVSQVLQNNGSLKKYFAEYKPAVITMDNRIMQAMDQGFSMLGNLFGGQGNNSVLSGLGDFFKSIFQFFFGFMTIAKKVDKEMNPGRELDQDDFQACPEGRGDEFGDEVQNLGPEHERTKARLNAIWRQDQSPNKEAAWSKLLAAQEAQAKREQDLAERSLPPAPRDGAPGGSPAAAGSAGGEMDPRPLTPRFDWAVADARDRARAQEAREVQALEDRLERIRRGERHG